MKIGLLGRGKTGGLVEQVAKNVGYTISSLEESDVCIDFTHPDAVMRNIDQLSSLKKNLVIGTTGWYDQIDQVKKWVEERDIGLVYAPNFSLGMALFMQTVKEAAQLYLKDNLYQVAGYEIHHNQKADNPSGTAIALEQVISTVKPCAPFQGIRCGHAPGQHTVIFDSPVDSVTLTHEARNREGFALGALKAAEWIHGKKGFYTFEEVIACSK